MGNSAVTIEPVLKGFESPWVRTIYTYFLLPTIWELPN